MTRDRKEIEPSEISANWRIVLTKDVIFILSPILPFTLSPFLRFPFQSFNLQFPDPPCTMRLALCPMLQTIQHSG